MRVVLIWFGHEQNKRLKSVTAMSRNAGKARIHICMFKLKKQRPSRTVGNDLIKKIKIDSTKIVTEENKYENKFKIFLE